MQTEKSEFEKIFAARRGVQPSDALAKTTLVWLERIPPRERPQQLMTQFPRIANAISEAWPRPANCQKYFGELLIDHRGGRQGFPAEVLFEISSLKNYYETAVHRPPKTMWNPVRAD
jgi:hypothetical protein